MNKTSLTAMMKKTAPIPAYLKMLSDQTVGVYVGSDFIFSNATEQLARDNAKVMGYKIMGWGRKYSRAK